MSRSTTRSRPRIFAALGCLLLLFGLGQLMLEPAASVRLGRRSLQLSTSQSSATADYNLTVTTTTTGTLGSILVEFCVDNPLPGFPCTPTASMNVGGASLISQTGTGDFAIDPASTNTSILLSRTPSSVAAGTYTFHLTGAVNPSSPGSYFVRLQTFASDDASGPTIDYGGIAFAITDLLTFNALVPPYLIFCTAVTIDGLNCANGSGSYVDFGELSPLRTGRGTSQLLMATNASGGFNVTVNGSALASGNNEITAMAAGDVSRPGTAQFGLNLRANSAPSVGADPTGPGTASAVPAYGQPNIFRFATGDVIITKTEPDYLRKYTASYIVNVPPTQPAGVYVSTMTFICLANF